MTIQNVSEFEAKLGRVVNAIDKVLVERGEIPQMKEARRAAERAGRIARDPAAIKAMRDELESHFDYVRTIISDNMLSDLMWDIVDFIDYRC